MKNPTTNQIATHIGHNVTAVGKPQSSTMRSPELTLLESSAVEEGCGFVPATSLVIQGGDSIHQLRDFCNEIMGTETATPPPHPMDECKFLLRMLMSFHATDGIFEQQDNVRKRLEQIPEAQFELLRKFLSIS